MCMKRCIIAFLFACFVCSCQKDWTVPIQTMSPPKEFAVCIDDSVQQQTISRVKEAVGIWGKSLERWRTVTLECSGDVLVVEGVCEEQTALACTNKLGGDLINLVKGKYEKNVVELVSHELGHVFGAQHTSTGLMAPIFYGQSACPDELTIKQVAAYNHVNADLLSFCY